ncbi:hypothetical protein, partial [Sulfuricurvum sp.]|uniref:hypothetical protein n=1 Tax=Sulfuricurvum sp. TaxID=2025608 RepID=UPI00261AB5B4
MKKILDFIGLFTREEIKDIIKKLLFKPLSSKLVLGGLTILITPFWQPILIEYLNKTLSLNIPQNSDTYLGIFLVLLGTLSRWFELYTDVQKTIHMKTAFKPSIESAKTIINIAVKNIGKRYSPLLNINSETVESFDYLCCDLSMHIQEILLENTFSTKFYETLFLIDSIAPSYETALEIWNTDLYWVESEYKTNKPLLKINNFSKSSEVNELKLFILKLINSIQIENIDDTIYFQQQLIKLLQIIQEVLNIKHLLYLETYMLMYNESDTRSDELLFDVLLSSLKHVIDFLNGDILKIFTQKSLLIVGEALSGKTHMFCDVALNRLSHDKPTLLFFGGDFSNEKTIVENMLSQLGQPPISEQDFLDALDRWGMKCETRTLLMIDAINENSPQLWESQLIGFLEKLKSYPHIAIVISIRDIEKRKIITSINESYFQENLVEIEHRGFENMEYEAVKHFCQCLGIEFPKIPLHTLKMFVNPGILLIYLETIQNSTQTLDQSFIQPLTIFKAYLSLLEEKFYKEYSNEVGLYDQTVQSAIEVFIDIGSKDNYSHFFIDYKLVLKELRPIHRKVLEFLIFEGVLNKTFLGEEERLYFTYQKFENFFIAHYLLKHFDKNESKIKMILEEHNFMLQEAILMQIAETTKKEPFELFENLIDNVSLCQMYFNSLIWRNPNTITQKTFDYLIKIQSKHRMVKDYFDLVMQLATYPNHPLNIENFHQKSLRKKMANRDLFLIPYFHQSYQYKSYVYRLIHWALENREFEIDNVSLKLYGITLGWFLISSNRELRDKTTKALVNLLTNRLDIVIEILKQFEGINDPYVYERLLAVAFGSAVRSKTTDHLKKLCEYIYHTIFDQEFVYPHILLRDYAKYTIDYAIYKEIKLDIDREKTIPPYRSHFPDQLPTNKEIDELVTKFPNPQDGLKDIVNSMKINFHNGISGDFGRKIFQNVLNDWEKQIDINLLSNHAVKTIIERIGYDSLKHGKLECNICSGYGYEPNEYNSERIGKKYQWIMLFEILAQVTDKYPIYGNWDEKEPYRGTFSPYVRDIDSTILLEKTHRNSSYNLYTCWHPTIDLD